MFRTFKLAIALNLLVILLLTGCGDSQTDNVEPQTVSQAETTAQDTDENEEITLGISSCTSMRMPT